MKFLVDLETVADELQTKQSKDEWALFILKCISSRIDPDTTRELSVVVAEPDPGLSVQ